MGGAVIGVAGSASNAPLRSSAKRGDEPLALPPQVDHVLPADRARELGSSHDAAIHALGVRGIEHLAVLRIGFNRDHGPMFGGQGPHGGE